MVVKGSEPAGPYGDHELFLQRQALGVRILRDRDRFFVDVGSAASQLWFDLPIVLEFVGLAASKTFVAGYSLDEQEANLKAQLELLAANSTLLDDLFRHDVGFDHRMSELDAFRREKARKRYNT